MGINAEYMGSQRQVGAGEMTSLPRFLVFALFLLSSVIARVVRRETNSLIEAAQEGNLERVRRLVSDAHAPDVNELGPDDRTPLIFAASFGDPAIVQELVQAGALVDFQDNFGWSPLHWAADTGHTSVVRQLISDGANVDTRDTEGWSPLHSAAYRGNMESVQELVTMGGADTSIVTKWTGTRRSSTLRGISPPCMATARWQNSYGLNPPFPES